MTNIDKQEFLKLFMGWYGNSLRPLNSALGYTEHLLSQGDIRESNRDNDVKESLEAIYYHSLLVKENWENAWHFLILNDDDIAPRWQAQLLHEVINMVLVGRSTSICTSTVQVNVSQDLPPIQGNQWVVRLLTCFLCPRVDGKQPGHIIIKTNQPVNSKLMIQVVWQEIPTYWSTMPEDSLFYPGSHLSIAKLVVERILEEKLEVDLSSNEMRFLFLLPMWRL